MNLLTDPLLLLFRSELYVNSWDRDKKHHRKSCRSNRSGTIFMYCNKVSFCKNSGIAAGPVFFAT